MTTASANTTIEPSAALCGRSAEHGLIAAECVALTAGSPDADGIAPCDSIDLVPRAAYVQTGLDVIAAAPTLPELVERIAESSFNADRFRVDLHDPSSRLAKSSQEVATTVANAIRFGPDLKDPLHRFIVAATQDRVLFGAVRNERDNTFRRHEDKPWTTSSSLDPRFSRALVNLVPDARSILDPYCGAGSIVLEAALLGKAAHGIDWKPAMVGMTRENIAHFGYDATVELADSRNMTQRADAIVTDLPYGHAIKTDEEVMRAILAQGREMAPIGVYVAPHDITEWLTDAGFEHIEVHTVVKRRGFTRWIHVAR